MEVEALLRNVMQHPAQQIKLELYGSAIDPHDFLNIFGLADDSVVDMDEPDVG